MTRPELSPDTPSQTVGPFFACMLAWPDGPYAVAPDAAGSFWLRGTVRDGAGVPVPDALIETWQADPRGRYDREPSPEGGVEGFARCGVDPDGRYAIRTVKPGPVPGPDGTVQAPHLAMTVFARGLVDRVVTRVYFPEDTDAHAGDPALAAAGEHRDTLIAVADGDGYRFDIHLQGPDETVFFEI